MKCRMCYLYLLVPREDLPQVDERAISWSIMVTKFTSHSTMSSQGRRKPARCRGCWTESLNAANRRSHQVYVFGCPWVAYPDRGKTKIPNVHWRPLSSCLGTLSRSLSMVLDVSPHHQTDKSYAGRMPHFEAV